MEEKKGPKKFSGQKTKKLIPILKKFNAIAETFIRTLTQRIDRKEKQLGKIAIMVKDIKVPERPYNIQVHTVDMTKVSVRNKTGGSYTQKMDWDQDYKSPKKGVIL